MDVVITSYNRLNLLLLALESVLFQKAHVNTIIIVDDNSSFTKDD
ncbi:glycosyltransferase, partial [Escherichia coli]